MSDSKPTTTTEKDSLISPEVQESIKRYMPYLEELRKKFFIVVGVFLVSAISAGVFYQHVFRFLLSRFNLTGINMVLTNPNQIIELGIETGIFIGLIVTVPVLIYFLLGFLKPALSPKEFKLIISLLPGSFLLFIFGFGFGIWVMQFVVSMFANAASSMNTQNLWDVGTFFSQIIFSGAAMGFLFQFPIILTALLRLNVIKRKLLVKQRSLIYVIMIIIAAILPSTDIFSLILLTIPLLLLFEITLLLNK
jgi:sec-independent protein translocase protein TatC